MKLLKTLLLCVLVLSIYSCEKSTRPKRELIVNDHLLDVGQKLAKKHKLLLNGSFEHPDTWSEEKNIHADFQVFRKLTKQEARAILVDCIETFDRETNHNKRLHAYLPSKGYPVIGFAIRIFIKPENQRTHYPELGLVAIFRDKVSYVTYNSEKEGLSRKTEEVETFEVAQHIVQHQHASLRE